LAYEAIDRTRLAQVSATAKRRATIRQRQIPMPKSEAPGGLFSSGRKVDVYPLDMLFFRNSGKRQAGFSRTTNYFFRQAKYV
jgi:hypothetical protein